MVLNRSSAFFPFFAACLSVVFLAGCSASSSVLVGEARPAIAPEEVVIYTKAPESYEEIALVESSSKSSLAFSAQGKMDTMIQRLKEEAAKLGANGVLLQQTGTEQGSTVSTGAGTATGSRSSSFGLGLGTSVGLTNTAGSGLAIYVENPAGGQELTEEAIEEAAETNDENGDESNGENQ